MKTYDVTVHYQGSSTYVVKANDESGARKTAEKRYLDDDPPDSCGSDCEDIRWMSVAEVPT